MGLGYRLSNFGRGLDLPAPARFSRSSDVQPVIAVSRSGNVTRVTLGDGRQIIGGGAQCDVVALGISPDQAFAIDIVTEGGRKRARLEALCPGITLLEKDLPQRSTTAIAAGQKISVDGVSFWLEGVAGAPSRITRRHLAAACLFGLSVVLLTVAISSESGDAVSSATAFTPSPRSGTTPVSILVNELREAVRTSGIAVEVTWNEGAGVIDVGSHGQPLALSAKTQLNNLLESFARRSEVMLRDKTRLSSGVENLIASVALEPVRFIVGTDGRRYREGDAIGGDWRIERISPNVITVARGSQRDELNLDPLSKPSNLRLAANNEASIQ